MGDISEYRGLLTAITFMGIFTLLLSLMPSQFYDETAQAGLVNVTVPESWTSTELLYLAETYNTTLGNATETDFDLGGRSFNLDGGVNTDLNVNTTMLFEFWYDWIFFRTEVPCRWKNHLGQLVNSSHENVLWWEEIDAQYSQDERFIAEWDDYQMYVTFSFDNSTYDSFEEAFYWGELGFWVGIQFDQINTSYNAWDIIGMLLFFSLPNVHPVINALIAIPIWIVIVYVSFILVLRVIGAVFGGGGA